MDRVAADLIRHVRVNVNGIGNRRVAVHDFHADPVSTLEDICGRQNLDFEEIRFSGL